MENLTVPQPNTPSKKKKRKSVTPSAVKRQPWTIAEDKLLTEAFLHVSKDCIVGNAKKGSDFWRRVLEYYEERESAGVVRTADNLKSHWHMMKNNVTLFNNIMIQLRAEKRTGLCDDQLRTQARTMYKENNKTSFIHEHVWDLVKDEPKWKKQACLEIEEPKRKETSGSCDQLDDDVDMPKRIDVCGDHTACSDANTYIELDDDVDDIPLALEAYPLQAYEAVEELPCSVDVKKAKVKTSLKGKGKGKSVEDVTTKLDYMFHKIVDMMEQFNAKTTQMLEFKEKKLEMEILYKDRSQMDPETLSFHKEHCAIIREKYGKK